ncbi:MAG: hypothetical protein FVQ77_02360 [Cytophagales bacterium]|nr:hypothetical protein [Cytophagales bacterium]
MLDKEFKYYLDNQDKLVKKYTGKYLVIKDNEVIGVHDTELDAYNKTQEQGHKLGTFLIQRCSEGQNDYTITLHSRPVNA